MAKIGPGQRWIRVFKELEAHGVMVVGGRIGDVGVGGFLLGGGYSYKTNQFGLGSDTVVEYELVTPTGEIITVNAESHPDLFFGLQVCSFISSNGFLASYGNLLSRVV